MSGEVAVAAVDLGAASGRVMLGRVSRADGRSAGSRAGGSLDLTEVHRFVNEWEKEASIDLRLGRTKVISTYFRHERIKDGAHEEMVDAAYLAWRADLRDGRSSLLVTESTDAVIELTNTALSVRLLPSA